jgi:hypothetical protein
MIYANLECANGESMLAYLFARSLFGSHLQASAPPIDPILGGDPCASQIKGRRLSAYALTRLYSKPGTIVID